MSAQNNTEDLVLTALRKINIVVNRLGNFTYPLLEIIQAKKEFLKESKYLVGSHYEATME